MAKRSKVAAGKKSESPRKRAAAKPVKRATRKAKTGPAKSAKAKAKTASKKKAAVVRKPTAKKKAPVKKAKPVARKTTKKVAKTIAKKVKSRKPVAKKSAPRKTTKAKATTARARKTVAAPPKKKVATKKVATKKVAPKKVQNPVAKKAPRKRATLPTPEPEPTGPITVQWGTKTIILADENKKVPKTKLSKKELRGFAKMLHDKRRELIGDMQHMSIEASSGRTGSTVPLHMADVGSDNWEQEFTFGLIENERSLIREIDEALERIENRTYGICIATHEPIDNARLRAKPWAKYCIEYARLRELGRVP